MHFNEIYLFRPAEINPDGARAVGLLHVRFRPLSNLSLVPIQAEFDCLARLPGAMPIVLGLRRQRASQIRKYEEIIPW